tara:strand:+ start:37 stop:321 length:285 start_codon:yes stop_codon:yes gene_type:complete
MKNYIDHNRMPIISRNDFIKQLAEIESACNMARVPANDRDDNQANDWMNNSEVKFSSVVHNKIREVIQLIMTEEEFSTYEDCDELQLDTNIWPH